jgi:hypothetical protein
LEKNQSLSKENKKLKLLNIGHEMDKAGSEGEHAQLNWKPLPKLPHALVYDSRVATSQNQVIVADLWKNEFYMSDLHSSDGSWSTVVNTHSTAGGEVRRLFNAGDECFGTFKNEGGKQSIAKYVHKRNQWQHVTDIPSYNQLSKYSITADRDHVYIVGGRDDVLNKKDTILVYDINTGKQCDSKMMNIKRTLCSSVIVDNLLYVGGGWDGQGNILNSVECIPLVGDCSHPRVADTPTYDCQLSSLCGQLVMTGGRNDGGSISNMVSVLSPSLNTWLPLPAMNQPRVSHGTCTVDDGFLLMVGGLNHNTLNNVELL